jgi:hypothetical protein
VDNDGDADLLLQSADGMLAVWTVQNTPGATLYQDSIWRFLRSEAGSGPAAPLGWRAAALADVDCDGVLDILFEGTAETVCCDHMLVVWFMRWDSAAAADSRYYYANWAWISPNSPGLGWHLRGAADYDSDGTPDLLFQYQAAEVPLSSRWYADGSAVIWFMHPLDGTLFQAPSPLMDVGGPEWSIVGPR